MPASTKRSCAESGLKPSRDTPTRLSAPGARNWSRGLPAQPGPASGSRAQSVSWAKASPTARPASASPNSEQSPFASALTQQPRTGSLREAARCSRHFGSTAPSFLAPLAAQPSVPERYFPRHFSLAASQRLRPPPPTAASRSRTSPAKIALEGRRVVQGDAAAPGLEFCERRLRGPGPAAEAPGGPLEAGIRLGPLGSGPGKAASPRGGRAAHDLHLASQALVLGQVLDLGPRPARQHQERRYGQRDDPALDGRSRRPHSRPSVPEGHLPTSCPSAV